MLNMGWQYLSQDLPRCWLNGGVAVQAMLDHTLLPAVERLEGPYQQAFNRICNQVQQGCSGLQWLCAAEQRGLWAVLLCMNVLPTVSSEPSNGASLSLRHVAALIDRLGRGISACFGRAGMLRSLHAYSMTAGCKSTGCLWCQTSHFGAASSALETARLAQACLARPRGAGRAG